MISAFTNIFKIPELRQRILFTVTMLLIVRAGAAITIPIKNTIAPHMCLTIVAPDSPLP